MFTNVRRPLWSLPIVIAAAALVSFAFPASAQNKTTLTVYTPLEREQLDPYKRAFEKDNPNITIAWLRESPGALMARLIAEKDAPKADFVWGVSSMHAVVLNKYGMVQPYAPKGYEKLKPQFRDTSNPPIWTGMDTWMVLICFNTVEAKKRNLPAPTKWSDLANPIYKGQITMMNPASSHSGFLTVNTFIETMGEAEAWKFMDRLHDNIASYTHGGAKPCKQAATGEYVIGISTDITAPQLKSQGAPIDIILPAEKSGWDVEATVIIKGTPKLAAAKALADWTVTKQANEEYNKYMAIVAHPDVNKVPPNYPANAEKQMLKYEPGKKVDRLAPVTAEWTKRYDAKSEPKT
ncbi:MAG: extracellular solute-binding protein [Burkholderiales bacterium]|nr:extracellular solute-binding protein [Burkholderiales bacterium]